MLLIISLIYDGYRPRVGSECEGDEQRTVVPEPQKSRPQDWPRHKSICFSMSFQIIFSLILINHYLTEITKMNLQD